MRKSNIRGKSNAKSITVFYENSICCSCDHIKLKLYSSQTF